MQKRGGAAQGIESVLLHARGIGEADHAAAVPLAGRELLAERVTLLRDQ